MSARVAPADDRNDQPAAERAYGPDLALVHHEDFGELAAHAATTLLAALRRAGVDRGMVVDLGCGTGILARRLTDAGYDVLGVDLSEAMLGLAAAEAPAATFVKASFLDVELPACVAVSAVGECFNYAFDPRMAEASLDPLFRRIAAALAPGGLLLFDVAGPGRAGPGRSSVAIRDTPRWTVCRRAEEEADGRILRRDITLFFRVDDSYRRSDEHHVLRLYRPLEVTTTLRGAGFSVRRLGGYGEFRFGPGWYGFLARRRSGR